MDFSLNDDQLAYQQAARVFARGELAPHAALWDEEKIFPRDVIAAAGELGFCVMYSPQEFGGLELTRLDALASNGDLQYYQFCKTRLAALDEKEIRPAPLVRGDDLIGLGCTPGPVFAEILRQVEDRQLGGELQNREAAIEWIRQNYHN